MPTITQESIAKKLGIDRTTVSKVLNQSTTHYVGTRTRQKILTLAKRLGYDFTRLRKRTKETAGQARVQIEAEAEIFTWEGQRHAGGQVTIVGLSDGAAELKNFRLDPPTIPLKPCTMKLRFPLPDGLRKGGEGTFVELKGHIVRMETGGLVDLAIEFADLSAEAAEAITLILTAAARQHPEAAAD